MIRGNFRESLDRLHEQMVQGCQFRKSTAQGIGQFRPAEKRHIAFFPDHIHRLAVVQPVQGRRRVRLLGRAYRSPMGEKPAACARSTARINGRGFSSILRRRNCRKTAGTGKSPCPRSCPARKYPQKSRGCTPTPFCPVRRRSRRSPDTWIYPGCTGCPGGSG